jgi:hypothetical protein
MYSFVQIVAVLTMDNALIWPVFLWYTPSIVCVYVCFLSKMVQAHFIYFLSYL